MWNPAKKGCVATAVLGQSELNRRKRTGLVAESTALDRELGLSRRLAAPGQKVKAGENQRVWICQMLASGGIQFNQFLLTGDPALKDLGPHASHQIETNGSPRVAERVQIDAGLDPDLDESSFAEKFGQASADEWVRALRTVCGDEDLLEPGPGGVRRVIELDRHVWLHASHATARPDQSNHFGHNRAGVGDVDQQCASVDEIKRGRRQAGSPGISLDGLHVSKLMVLRERAGERDVGCVDVHSDHAASRSDPFAEQVENSKRAATKIEYGLTWSHANPIEQGRALDAKFGRLSLQAFAFRYVDPERVDGILQRR